MSCKKFAEDIPDRNVFCKKFAESIRYIIIICKRIFGGCAKNSRANDTRYQG
jgi:hypothetical protein